MKHNLIGLFILGIIFTQYLKAADVEVPQDELSQESVYPVFDHPQSVKNRNVKTESRFDMGLFAGFALTEPIYNTSKYGLAVNYHFSELHSLGLLGSINSAGLTGDAENLHEAPNNLDFNRAPKPKSTILLDYNYKPFYGKLSITKATVINTTIFGSLSAGAVAYEHKTYPAVALGIGERFYFTNSLSLKTDLRLMIHEAPIPFYKNDGTYGLGDGSVNNATPPPYSKFKDRINYITNLEIGLNYLF